MPTGYEPDPLIDETGLESESDTDEEFSPLSPSSVLRSSARARPWVFVAAAGVVGALVACCVFAVVAPAPAVSPTKDISARMLMESPEIVDITTEQLVQAGRIVHRPREYRRTRARVVAGFRRLRAQLKVQYPKVAQALETITLNDRQRQTVLRRMRYHGDIRLQRVGLEVARVIQQSSGLDKAGMRHKITEKLRPRIDELRQLYEEVFPAANAGRRLMGEQRNGKSTWDSILHPNNIRLMKTFDQGWDAVLGTAARRLEDTTVPLAQVIAEGSSTTVPLAEAEAALPPGAVAEAEVLTTTIAAMDNAAIEAVTLPIVAVTTTLDAAAEAAAASQAAMAVTAAAGLVTTTIIIDPAAEAAAMAQAAATAAAAVTTTVCGCPGSCCGGTSGTTVSAAGGLGILGAIAAAGSSTTSAIGIPLVSTTFLADVDNPPPHIMKVIPNSVNMVPTQLPVIDVPMANAVSGMNFTDMYAMLAQCKAMLQSYKGMIQAGAAELDPAAEDLVNDLIASSDAILEVLECTVGALEEFQKTNADPLEPILSCPQQLGATGTSAIGSLLYDANVSGATYGFPTTPVPPE